MLVEDEVNIAQSVILGLSAQGHTVAHAKTLAAAREQLLEANFDLLLLDIMLPDDPEGGFHLAEEVIGAGYTGHILYLTARDSLEDRLRGLDGGGDDYLAKPFDMAELLARVRAVVRRTTAEVHSSRIQFHSLIVDFKTREVIWKDHRVYLTPREFSLLERFVLQPKRIYSIPELHYLIWDDNTNDLSVVRQTVRRLRNRLDPEIIETLPSGYRLGTLEEA